MATTIVSEKLRRWQGTIADVQATAALAEQIIQTKTGVHVNSSATTTIKKVETEFDSLDDFSRSSADDFTQIEKLSVTVGDFSRDSLLSCSIVFSNRLAEPGVQLRVRGHDQAFVDWLAAQSTKQLEKGARWLPVGEVGLYFILLAIMALVQYPMVGMLDLSGLNDFTFYLAVIVLYMAPTVAVLLALSAIRWLIPQAEFKGVDGSTRWSRNRRRAIWSCGVLATAVVLPVLVPVATALVSRQVGLD